MTCINLTKCSRKKFLYIGFIDVWSSNRPSLQLHRVSSSTSSIYLDKSIDLESDGTFGFYTEEDVIVCFNVTRNQYLVFDLQVSKSPICHGRISPTSKAF